MNNGKEILDETYSVPAELKEGDAIYFIGIGGIGMSALARFFKEKGFRVSGYDRVETTLTKQLTSLGIEIHYTDNVKLVPEDPQLVVYTPAIPADLAELIYCREQGYRVIKRSELLEWITKSSFNVCVSGTHGKTTITTMIAHILRNSGFGCNAFLGGIAVNYDSNFWSSERNVCVVEADEYDRSFLKLSPSIAVVTAMDADHLDIYGDATSMEDAFIEFTNKVRKGGTLITHFGLKRSREFNQRIRRVTYSLGNDAADVYAEQVRMEEGSYEFDVCWGDLKIENIRLNMGGMHNVENAIAAITVASSLEIEPESIRAAVESFRGVKRRFEYILKNDRIVYIDDYAHHPEELKALITGARTLFRQRRITVLFQPHLFTRTRDLAEGFSEALDLADEVILLPIYPARELPVPGISSNVIAGKMNKAMVEVVPMDRIIGWLQSQYLPRVNKEFGEVLITAGAGDIDTLVDPIKEILSSI